MGQILVPVLAAQTLSVPLAASTTTLGARFNVAYPYDAMVILATLTGMSAGTLDMYVQESWDGSTWSDVAHFAQLAAAAAVTTQRVVLANGGLPLVVGSAGTPALAAAKFVDAPWAPTLRLVAVTGSGTNAAPVVQTVSFAAWQRSH